MNLTTQQRLLELERMVITLADKLQILHDMLKHQNSLITDYLTLNTVVENSGSPNTNTRKEDAVFTFVCRKRFDRIQKDIQNLREIINKLDFKNRAG